MEITRQILIQYADLKQEVIELRNKIEKLEEQIKKIEAEGSVVDKVMGGEGGIQSFKIEGFPYAQYSRKKTLLYARKDTLSELELELLEMLNNVEYFISTIADSRMRRIVNLRVVEGLSWNKVADCIGGKSNENSVRQLFCRFMDNDNN